LRLAFGPRFRLSRRGRCSPFVARYAVPPPLRLRRAGPLRGAVGCGDGPARVGVHLGGPVQLAGRSESGYGGTPPPTVTHSPNGRGRAGGAGVWDVKRSSP